MAKSYESTFTKAKKEFKKWVKAPKEKKEAREEEKARFVERE